MGAMKAVHEAATNAGVGIPTEMEMQWAVVVDGLIVDVWFSESDALEHAGEITPAWDPDRHECLEVIPILTFKPIIVRGDESVGIQ